MTERAVMSVTRVASRRTEGAPFDFEASGALPGWRDAVYWPVSYRESFRICRDVTTEILAVCDAIADETLHRAALLGLGSVMAEARALAEMAFVAQAEVRQGTCLVEGPASRAQFRGEAPEDGAVAASPFKPISHPRGVFLRRTARVASWTPFWRVPAALAAPEITAVSHNELLIDAARAARQRVGFRHAEMILAAARTRAGLSAGDLAEQIDDITETLARAISRITGLDEPYRERLYALVRPKIPPAMGRAAIDLAGLQELRALPRRLWSGSGGYYPSRAVGLEVQRRGGHVTRFGHGWFAAMTGLPEAFAFSDLAVSDRYVAETSGAARNLESTGAASLMPRSTAVEIVGHDGPSPLSALALDAPSRAEPARRRVIYAPTILRGARQFLPPLLPDVIYLDWQLRLVEMVQAMPLDLRCKPHPEGLLRGQPHPLGAVAATSAAPFESHIAEADVFLFDYGQSTTFAEALCTDRPIVFIDLGNPAFSDAARAMIERRCRVIQARFDHRNRPHIEPDELEEALRGGRLRVDPGEVRALLMGHGAG